MLWLEDKLVSDDILETYFACELSSCKGACCWEGSFGAPVDEAEFDDLDEAAALLKEELPEESQRVIDENGAYTWYEGMEKHGTALRENGACVFLKYNGDGIGYCAIERAWREGRTSFRKPISCHLYPIRVTKHEITGMTSLNYDKWSICSAACNKGERLMIPLYQFAKEALIRAFGEEFYRGLEEAAERED